MRPDTPVAIDQGGERLKCKTMAIDGIARHNSCMISETLPLRRRRLQYSLGSLLIVLTFCAVTLAWFVRPKHSPVEYRVIGRGAIEGLGSGASITGFGSTNTAALNTGLNELGAEGWELIAIENEHQTSVSGGTIQHEAMYFFKRLR